MRITKPIPKHTYHGMTDVMLRWIIKDAGEAAIAMRDLGNLDAEAKYLDQVNDASTVLHYRQQLVAAGLRIE